MQRHNRVPYPMVGSIFGEPELDALRDALLSGQPLSAGTRRLEFERAIADLVGRRYAFSVTSGTVSLEFAIRLLDLKPGDEVISTPQSYLATVEPLLGAPLTVRFADVLPDSLNVDPQSVAELVTPRTRAIVLVHYGGAPADTATIRRIADAHDLLLVEDCAHALGTLDRGRPAGSLGDVGCFSFHSSKNISTLGEGGMLVFDRHDWAERVSRMRGNQPDAVYTPAPQLFGTSHAPMPEAVYPGLAYTHDCVELRHPGTNAALGEPAAAVGIVQLQRLPELVRRRQQIAARYTEALQGLAGVRVPAPQPDITHAYHLFTFFIESNARVTRDELLRSLKSDGIETQLRYFPLHLLPEWRMRGHRYGECPIAERLWFHHQMNLPCQPSLRDDQVDAIVAALQRALSPRPQRVSVTA